MASSCVNTWLPAVIGIIGTLLGAISAFIPKLITEHCKAKKQSSNLKSALIAEIQALLKIIESRRYREELQEVCDRLSTQPPGTSHPVSVQIPEHYSRIYQANCIRIGEIDSEIASEIVIFHQLIDAIAQDFCPAGVFANGAELHAYQQAVAILQQAIEIGQKLTNSHNNSSKSTR